MTTPSVSPPKPHRGRTPKALPCRFDVDEGGRAIALVTIPNAPSGQPVRLLREDWEDLSARGLANGWHWANSGDGCAYVVRNIGKGGGKRKITVARLILNAPPRRPVRLRNGCPHDLTRDNLDLAKG